MNSQEIRGKFLKFFEDRGHRIVPSSSLVPDDPTMLLTTAGMVQFKPIFLGTTKPEYTRATSVQKSARTTDIDRVGRTARHLTFFEMLGNFSFGDYYKKDAIPWAWELLTKVYRLDPADLWITVYLDDDEAFHIWNKDVGIAAERITRVGEDNFWAAGPTGPCGPSSEIMFDMGSNRSCGPDCKVGCDCDRWLEVWNLVFMQYDRDEEAQLNPLERKGIDTGMGLERLASILQGVDNNFETDQIKPVLDQISKMAGVACGNDPESDISLKIVTDHSRAITFLINDGVLPSNEGRGYVLRRLIRRAVRHGRLLGVDKPMVAELIRRVVETMSEAYPDISENRSYIERIAASEEQRFAETLKAGLGILEDLIETATSAGHTSIDGSAVFQLYDTYGFPLELTEEITAECGLTVDRERFDELMAEARERARASWVEAHVARPKEVYAEILDNYGPTVFMGYEKDETPAKVLALVKGEVAAAEASADEDVEVILDCTPFYAEMGGEVGDRGVIETETGTVDIHDTQSVAGGLYVHLGRVSKGTVVADQKAVAAIEAPTRLGVARNHSATHLLHWALRTILGSHVKQAGSFVAPDRLRFDFTHFQAMTPEEIMRTERLVNAKILQEHPVHAYSTTYAYGKESGALAFFGEKYGEYVRLVEMGNFSKEFCGGIHVSNTSEIGLMKIVSEGSVGANTRRIEALTGEAALEYVYREEEVLSGAAGLLKSDPLEVAVKVGSLMDELKAARRELERRSAGAAKITADELVKEARAIDSTDVVIGRVDAGSADELRNLADMVRRTRKSSIVFLAAIREGKVMLVAAATPDLAERFNAGELMKRVAPIVGGGGGGRADLAQAGGRQPDKIGEALDEAWRRVKEMMKS